MNDIIYKKHLLSKEDINSKVRLLINELYDCCYNGNLTIDKLYPIGYKVSIPLHNIERPFVIAIEAEGDIFFKYLKNALLESSLSSIDFFTISDTMEVLPPINENIKGDYSNIHRVLQDNIIYVIENNNS